MSRGWWRGSELVEPIPWARAVTRSSLRDGDGSRRPVRVETVEGIGMHSSSSFSFARAVAVVPWTRTPVGRANCIVVAHRERRRRRELDARVVEAFARRRIQRGGRSSSRRTRVVFGSVTGAFRK